MILVLHWFEHLLAAFGLFAYLHELAIIHKCADDDARVDMLVARAVAYCQRDVRRAYTVALKASVHLAHMAGVQ